MLTRRHVLGMAACLPTLAAAKALAQDKKPGMDALECIHTRRSVRKYLDKPIPDELIQELLQAAMTAPSAFNEQPWRFVVVRDKEKLKAVSAGGGPGIAGNAAAAILVCGDTTLAKEQGMWPLDCSNATMNILLAANALGLGGVWTASYPVQARMDLYRKLFNVPEKIIPFAFVCLGYPEKPGWKENRFKADRIVYDGWK